MQSLWVPPESLPHDNAETAKTGSNRIEGVLYNFFPDAGSDFLSFEELLVSNYPSRYSIP